MADGRMLKRKISLNKDLPRLTALVDERLGQPHGAFAALLYTWCIAHLDAEGRMHGDPVIVKSVVFTRYQNTAEQVEAYLLAMAEIGLVAYYEAEGDRWLAFPGFARCQPGLRKEREAESLVPAPECGRSLVQSNSGVGQEQVPQKVSEVKVSEYSLPRARVGELTTAEVHKIWFEVTGKQPSGNPVTVSETAKLCTAAAGTTPAPEHARRLFGAFVALRDWYVANQPPEPPPTLEAFVRHFARVEDWLQGRKPALKRDGRAPPAQPRPIPPETDMDARLASKQVAPPPANLRGPGHG